MENKKNKGKKKGYIKSKEKNGQKRREVQFFEEKAA